MKPPPPANDLSITDDKVFICPDCGSPAVTASSLAGGNGACRKCPWKGPVEELLVVPIQHTMGSADEIKHVFHAEMKNLFGKIAASLLLKHLLRWGFLPEKVPTNPAAKKAYVQLVGRYVEAAARGAANAILETRDALEVDSRMGGKEVPRA